MGQNSRQMYGLTMGTIKSGLVKGTNKSYTTTVTTAGMINGKYVTTLAAQTNTAVPTTDCVTGTSFVPMLTKKATVFVMGQTAAGAIQMCQGSVEDTLLGVTTTAGDFIRAPQFPTLPDDFMVLGYALVRTAPSMSTTWTLGTDNWAATGVTTTEFVQCGTLPDRPQTS